jgi:hypothetical protein
MFRDCCKSVVEIPWFAGTILRVVLVLSALGILYSPDPSVLLDASAVGSSAKTSVSCSLSYRGSSSMSSVLQREAMQT